MKQRKDRGRATPPTELTGEERDFLLNVVASGERVQAQLRNGRRISGRILDFDVDSIRFDLDDGEETVSKSVIRYLQAD